jgi:cbb3-type cytochrome oxidase maturation protein
MTILGFLIPAALLLGLGGLLAFLWTVRSGQYEDLEGAAARILIEDEADRIEPEDPAPKARS